MRAIRVHGTGGPEVLRHEEDVAVAEPGEGEARAGGRGVSVVYDGVGQTTFRDSLASLRPRGMLVLYGQASGPVEPFDPAELARGGSLFLTRPSLAEYTADRAELEWRAGEVLGAVEAGDLDVRIHEVLPLAEAERAHRMLEGRETSGKLLLRP